MVPIMKVRNIRFHIKSKIYCFGRPASFPCLNSLDE